MRRPRSPLRSRLVVKVALAFLVASVAPLVGLGLVTDQRLARQLEEEARRRHQEVARNANALVDVWLEGVQSGLTDLAIALRAGMTEEERQVPGESSNSVDWHLRNSLSAAQNAQAAPFQELQLYCLPGDDGTVEPLLVGRLDLPGGTEFDDAAVRARGRSEVVQQALNDATPWIGSNFERNAGRRTLSLSVPMKLADDAAGALVGDVDTDGLADLLEALAGDRYGLEVRDALGEVLVDTFARSGGSATRSGWLVAERPMRAGEWSVVVGEPTSVVRAPLHKLRARTSWATGIAVVLAAGLSLALSLRITRPVETLEARAMELAGGDLSVRTGLRGDDEIGRLSRAFDEMAASLEQLDRAKSDFVFTVSHELRTPLTSLRLAVANLIDGVNGEVNASQERTLRRIATDLDGLGEIVQDLLRLARYEAGAATPEQDEVDLGDVVRRAVRAFEPAFERKNVRLVVEPGSSRVRTDAALVQRVLANLVQNALQFAPNGSRVVVRVEPGAVRVLDEGLGFPAGAVVEPFEKAGRTTEGFGLGLSIATRIAKVLGGALELGARADGSRGASAGLVLDTESDA